MDRERDEVPTIYWDYGFLDCSSEGCSTPEQERAEDEKGISPILIAWDSSMKRFWAHVVPRKGVDFDGLDAVLNLIVKDLQGTGYKQAIFRSDGEPSLVALLRAVAQRWGAEVIPQVSAPGDYKSHGAVENAVKLCKGHS